MTDQHLMLRSPESAQQRLGSSRHSAEILATTENLVPTAFDGQRPSGERPTPVTQPSADRPPEPLPNVTEPSPDAPNELPDWRVAMKRAVRCSDELRRRVHLPTDADAATAHDVFPTFVPLEYLSRIRTGDPADPLLLQVLPTRRENRPDPESSADPVGDREALAAPGLLHKYDGRALLVATGACGVHCRYCFRREFPYSQDSLAKNDSQAALDYIRSRPEIDEVLLSGGDPLTLVDERLHDLIQQVESIQHVRRLRIHSRMPVVIPQRMTPALIDMLTRGRLTSWMVVHINHPQEIDRFVTSALARMIDAGIPVLNQSVLLRGINDDAKTLIELSRRLVDLRVQPYYLHQLDRVHGASHFDVPVQRGRELVRKMRAALPGYAVPTYVAEEPGKASKSPL